MRYHITTGDYSHINRIWDWCQYTGRDIPMYRCRLGMGNIGWVVEVSGKIETVFLLNFSH
jgi:hypothetical protein